MLVVINKDSLMHGRLCGKLHCRRSHLLFALQQSSIDSQIFVENRDFCLPHLHSTPGVPSEYCHVVWCVKSRMIWLPDGEEKSEDTPTRFDRIHECDRQTDRHTPHDGIDRAYA